MRTYGLRHRGIVAVLLVLTLGVGQSLLSAPNASSGTRVKPPQWGSTAASQIFFPDLFNKGLIGERPATLGIPSSPAGIPAGTVAGNPGMPAAGGGGSHPWAQVISADTLQNEVKAIKTDLDQSLTTPTDFKGRGYSKARRSFSVLAMLFAIISEYDGDVRWKPEAPTARDAFARVGYNCKAGTDQSFQEAKLRSGDLGELVGGGTITANKQSEPQSDWSQVCDRAPLMQRLDSGYAGKIMPWTASKDAFNENAEKLMHEAEIMGAIAEAMKQKGMADADDSTYAGLCDVVKNSAKEIVDAVKNNNDEQARKAVGAITKSCNDCHESYRG